MGKRGVSPLIATVLLIGFVIVLAALIIRFGSELTRDELTQVEFQQDRSIIFDVDFEVKTANIEGYTITFEVTNKESSTLDSFLVRVDGILVTCTNIDAIPGFNTQIVECSLPIGVTSCPGLAEFIPQVEINGELTSLLLSIQEDTSFSCGDEDLSDSHLACVGLTCQFVPGLGPDSCSSDSDCYYLTCVGGSCTLQEGTGMDSCFYQGSSCNVNEPKHLECLNQACMEVSGEGDNHEDCSAFGDPCELPLDDCTIREVYWSDTLGGNNIGDFIVDDNTLVYPTIITKNCQNGETLTLELCEDDLFGCDPNIDDPVKASFPTTITVFNNKASLDWTAQWYDSDWFFDDPEYKFYAINVLLKEISDNKIDVNAPLTPTHLECDSGSYQCKEVVGPGMDQCGFVGETCGLDPNAPSYPMLQANIFDELYDSPICRQALSVYSGITQGALWSSKYGGYDYGTFNGFGDHKSDVYPLGDRSVILQDMYKSVQETNPNFKVFSHRSLAKMESQDFVYGMTTPTKWLADSLSSRWFRYTPLMKLQEAVSDDPSVRVFKFLKNDVTLIESWDPTYFPNGPGYSKWDETNKYYWYYLSFFDNDKGAGRGEFEIMAIDYVTYDATYAYVTVTYKGINTGRTIFGTPQSYSVGHRAGIISSSAPNFGSLSFSMNHYCRRELEDTTNCDQTRVDGSNWVEAASFYTSEFLMKAMQQGVYLNDGVLLDADSQKEMGDFGFRFGDPSNYHLDVNLDGKVDKEGEILSDIAYTYIDFYSRVKNDADTWGRGKGTQNEFLIIINGYLNTEIGSHKPLNGKRYEDFNGGFMGTYPEALEQYAQSYTDSDFLETPVISLVSERDRCYYVDYAQYYCPEGGHYNPNLGVNSNNFDDHRNILAMTLVMGDGYYGHDYNHATGIPVCSLKPRDDWFDEFSVDENGVSSKHKDYDAEEICYDLGQGEECKKDRFEHVGWLGRALGEGYELSGYPKVYRRNFEHGIVLFNTGYTVTVSLEKPYKKILGVDLDNNGIFYNDGSSLSSITLDSLEGIILLNV